MAQSPSHKFGQIIGDLLEELLRQPLEKIAKQHGLYLDYKRKARENKKKVCWTDEMGNRHDLDYVLEHGGSEERQGIPKAFIESAWRRYTKHSRNKVQEIQCAVSMLADTYRDHNPFLGVVLAGVFTEGALQQLESHGFKYVYYSYETIIEAFSKVGIDAAFDEETPDESMWEKVRAYQELDPKSHKKLVQALRRLVKKDLDQFLVSLEQSLQRRIQRILIAGVFGENVELKTVDDAVTYIEEYSEKNPTGDFIRYEIDVRYSNGDQINGNFEEKRTAISFLKALV